MRQSSFFLLLFFAGLSCAAQEVSMRTIPIVPTPASVVTAKGVFAFGPKTIVVAGAADTPLARVFTEYLRKTWKFNIPVAGGKEALQGGGKRPVVLLGGRGSERLPSEGYRLSITPDSIVVLGKGAGLFYGIQSLIQLFPVSSETVVRLPCLTIEDRPRYRYRGFMLDVSRHFFTVAQVKDVLDWMAFYKLNRFHWHLTDDQGWRLEIKSYPKLTQVGAWRVPRIEFGGSTLPPQPGEKATDGGFYTQEQVKEIVRYAAGRCIDVIPEIDVPGHSLAAVAAYPELSVTRDTAAKVNPGSSFATWFPKGGFEMHVDNTLNPTDERVYVFLDRVLGEVAALFPGKYIHIGGDECYKGYWEKDSAVQGFMRQHRIRDGSSLQGYFISRLDGIIRSKGKEMIGWDEICQGDSVGKETVMNRLGEKAAVAQTGQGRDLILASHEGTSGLYFDYTQSESDMEPSHHGGSPAPLWHSFLYDPDYPSLGGEGQKHILGVEACLWTEYVSSMEKLYYMVLPRLLGVAETGWSLQARKSWSRFARDVLPVQLERFDRAGVNYRVPPATDYVDTTIYIARAFEPARYEFTASIPFPGAKVYFTLDNSCPSEAGQLYSGPTVVRVPAGMRVILKTIVITPAGRRSIVTRAVIDNAPLVITTNQASKKIEIYDPAVGDWNKAAALMHAWYPNAANGFTDTVPGWGLPSEARVRNSSFFGGQQLLVADSYGFCAVIPYPALRGRTWSIYLGAGVNPHAIELLPNGNVAIAASDGNFVRVYASSQGAGSAHYASFRLLAAHAALWDPAYHVLWVTGQDSSRAHVLTALEITGTAAEPVLTEMTAFRTVLPSPWGHDVQPYAGDINRLWVSTNAGVYIFDKRTRTFRAAAVGAMGAVKGVSNLLGGMVAITRPDAAKKPMPLEPSIINAWSSSYVDFYSADGGYMLSGHVKGAAFYKGRFVMAEYQ